LKRPKSKNKNCQMVRFEGPDGTLLHRLTVDEARAQIKRGTCFHVGGATYRMYAPPSKSKDSACQLTLSDMQASAGLIEANEVWAERLAGFGLGPIVRRWQIKQQQQGQYATA
jgi:hypothetical protein